MTTSWDPSEPNAIERLQVVYKIAERCNLNCSYCYYYNMGDQTALARPARASLPGTTNLGQWLAQGCEELNLRKVLVSFHGGEPMLMRALEFAKGCEALVRAVSPVADIAFSIQTNGTLLTDGWLEALRLYKVAVGVSIDGLRHDHDRFRLDHHGESSFSATEATLQRLVQASERWPSLQPGTISVLHHEADYAEVYAYLRGLGIKSMHFLLPDRSADGADADSERIAAALGRGMLDLFEAWMTEDDPDINVRFISETLGYFQLGHEWGPVRRERKTNQVIVARSDQTVAIDDSLIPALDWYATIREFPIAKYTLREVFRDPIFRLVENERNQLPDACRSCSWASLCRGGDLENRYSRDRGFNNPSVYCETYKVLFAGMQRLLVGFFGGDDGA